MREPGESGAGGAVIVMGVCGSGKSTLGAMLADALRCPFLEGDDFHSAGSVEKMRRGEPLTDDDRWPWLDRLGAAIRERVATDGIAVAACSALKRAYRDRLRAAITGSALFVLPQEDTAELARRIAARPGHYMPPSLLDSQLETFEPPQADEAVLTIVGGTPPEQALARVQAWLARAE